MPCVQDLKHNKTWNLANQASMRWTTSDRHRLGHWHRSLPAVQPSEFWLQQGKLRAASSTLEPFKNICAIRLCVKMQLSSSCEEGWPNCLFLRLFHLGEQGKQFLQFRLGLQKLKGFGHGVMAAVSTCRHCVF